MFKTLRSIVLLNAKEKVCQEKASLQYIGFGFVLHSTHTERVLFWKTQKKKGEKIIILSERVPDRNIELTLNESGPLIEKA